MTLANSRGFTLIEVMIVVAIIGILAGIAYSSYSNQVMRSNRSDAKSALNDVSQRLQRCYTTYSAYDSEECGVHEELDDGVIDSSEGLYTIDYVNNSISATTFTLVATPVSAPQTNDDECDDMSLAHTGRRAPADCW